MLITAAQEKCLITDLLKRLSATIEEAEICADVFTEADLRGHESQGLLRLPLTLRRLIKGTVKAAASPKLRRDFVATAVLDGDGGLGPVVAKRAMEIAISKAAQYGIGAVGTINGNHAFMMGYYAEMAAKQGMVGLALTNCDSLVHPYGGRQPMFGTNPFACAFPTTGSRLRRIYRHPVVIDFATSVGSFGKILKAQKNKEPIPEGWALDANGVPTTDPFEAAKGAMSPMAGHKGSALALAIEVLAGGLIGAAMGPEVRGTVRAEDPCNKGDLFIAISPQAFLGGETEQALENALDAFLEQIRGSPVAAGFEEIVIPGERSYRTRELRLREGIPVDEEVWKEVAAVATELGVPLPEALSF